MSEQNFTAFLDPAYIFEAVGKSAQTLGTPAYVVGGFVRDLLNKRVVKATDQKQDIDFVCVGSGEDLALQTAQLLGGNPQVHVFKNFGTASIKFSGYDLEFVGARKESYKPESRKPVVETGTMKDDQLRRDFTINALAISLNPSDYGSLTDPFEGLQDLKNKIIRTPIDANITFSDDPLRMIRAVRFATQLGFDIEADTFAAIGAQKQRLQIVSMERIHTELNKIIMANKPSYGFKLLYIGGLLEIIFPELVRLQGTENQEGRTHKDNFYHTLEVLDHVALKSDDLWLRWAALLHDIAKPITKRYDPKIGWTFHGHEDKGARMVPGIFKRLKLPLDQKMKFVQELVRLHLRPIALAKDIVTDSAVRRLVVEAGPCLEALMILCRADVTTKNSQKAKKYLDNFDKVDEKIKEVELKDNLRNFQPVLTGEHIMAALGIGPSPLIGQIKIEIREAILEGIIANEMQATFDYLCDIAAKKGLPAPRQV